MPLDPRLAAELVSVVDTRVSQLMKMQPRTAYGVVQTVDAANFKCSVYVSGDAAPSAGFVFPPWCALTVGDRVRVVIDPRGDRYVDEVYSPRTAAARIVGHYESAAAGNIGGLTTPAAITGASLSVPVKAGRVYWIYGEALLQSTVGTDRLSFELFEDSNQLNTSRQVTSQITSVKFATSALVVPGADATKVYTLRAGRSTGTGTVTVVQGTSNPTILVVFDGGPA